MCCGTPWKPFVAGNEPQKGRIWGREGVTPPPAPFLPHKWLWGAGLTP